MKPRTILTIAGLCVALTTAHSQTVNYLGDLETDLADLAVEPAVTCYLGNLRTPGALESFGYDIMSMYAPLDSVACGCEGGWQVTEIHLLLANTTTGPAGAYLMVAVDGQGTCTYPSGCLEPHPGYWGELFDTWFGLTLPEPGYYELVIPASSDCAYFGHAYFLEVWGNPGGGVSFVVDADGFRECEVLEGWHIGERWAWGAPAWAPTSGAPIWWVEAACCETPVINESRSWSELKALYR